MTQAVYYPADTHCFVGNDTSRTCLQQATYSHVPVFFTEVLSDVIQRC